MSDTTGKHIFVIEGPAGSGKSSLIYDLQRNYGGSLDVVSASLEKRTGERGPMDPHSTAAAAYQNDLVKASQVVDKLLNGDKPMVILERFGISQHVYGHIRRCHAEGSWAVNPPMPREASAKAFNRACRMIWHIYRDHLFYRGQEDTSIVLPGIHWVFMDPTSADLQLRRASSPKPYPFGSTEFDVYNQFYHNLISFEVARRPHYPTLFFIASETNRVNQPGLAELQDTMRQIIGERGITTL